MPLQKNTIKTICGLAQKNQKRIGAEKFLSAASEANRRIVREKSDGKQGLRKE